MLCSHTKVSERTLAEKLTKAEKKYILLILQKEPIVSIIQGNNRRLISLYMSGCLKTFLLGRLHHYLAVQESGIFSYETSVVIVHI